MHRIFWADRAKDTLGAPSFLSQTLFEWVGASALDDGERCVLVGDERLSALSSRTTKGVVSTQFSLFDEDLMAAPTSSSKPTPSSQCGSPFDENVAAAPASASKQSSGDLFRSKTARNKPASSDFNGIFNKRAQ